MTVRDVLVASDDREPGHRVREWAEDVWRAWAPQQNVRAWLDAVVA